VGADEKSLKNCPDVNGHHKCNYYRQNVILIHTGGGVHGNMRYFRNISKTILHKVQLLHAVINDIRNRYRKVRKPVLINKTF